MSVERRLDYVRERLGEAEYGAFVSLSSPDNEYLSGFHGSTSAVVITANEAHFLCDFRYTEQARQQVQTYAIQEVTGAIETRAGEQLARLGVATAAFDPVVTTVQQANTVQDAFGGSLHPAPGFVAKAREVKSPEEIERIRSAVSLAETAMLDLVAGLEAGVPEREAAARLEYEFKKRGAQGAAFDSIALFGARTSLPHGMPGDKRLEAGDVILIDCGCIRESYCSDLTRTYVFDTIPGAWFEEIYRVTRAAQQAGLEAVRAGAVCREVDAAARNVIREAGYGDCFGHGLGHGVGLEVHEAPRLNMESDTVLEAGMVVTVEPGIYLPGRGGVRIEDLVVVTEDGCDILSESPKELRIISP